MVDDPDPASVADAAATFREEYDRGADALETVLAVDAERDAWTFDDLPLDSGTFGELVSRGIVTRHDDEYRISSRRGVEAGLEGRSLAEDRSTSDGSVSFPISIDVRAAAALVGALCLAVVTRTLTYDSVYRDGRVVSPANDPYHYRYWLEELLATSEGITDASVVTTLSENAASRRPFTHAANWFFAELLGGDQWAAETVAAWLPVVATVALGVVVYWLAVVLTDDVRVGVASVVLLALTPIHAGYTSLGFLEHRLYQYFWFGATLLALAWLAVDLRRRRDFEPTPSAALRAHLRCPWTWVAAGGLGIALGCWLLTWGGSILLLIPLAAYVGSKVVLDVRAGLSPGPANAPILVGLGLSASTAAIAHLSWNWHESFTVVVAVLVAVGAVAVAGLGEVWRRLEWPVRRLAGVQLGLAAVGVVAIRQLRPAEWSRLLERAGDLFFRVEFAESVSLFTPELGVVFGPLAQLGLNFYLALLILGWVCWISVRRYEPGWTLLATVVGFWLVLAAIQLRFAAQLSIALSIFGGLGFVQLMAWIDLARPPAPFRNSESTDQRIDRRSRSTAADGGGRQSSIEIPRDIETIASIVTVGLLICGLSLVYLPSLTAQMTHEDAKLEATTAIEEHSTVTDRQYPENFVLSEWDENRLYNYFVNGESRGYGYANKYYDDFRADGDPDGWYEQFDDRVGYVIVTDSDSVRPENASQTRLRDDLGARDEPLEHYRALYVHDDVAAFAVVPGATIVASGEPGETIAVETEVTLADETIRYERDAAVGTNGTVAVTVPYPGEYAVGGRSVTVESADVEAGSTIRLE